MYIKAIRQGNEWRVSNAWGHELSLPGLPPDGGPAVRIGTLGTKFEARINARTGNRATVVARMLQSLHCPVLLVDTRRSGCGAQGSWSPLEFATLIPAQIGHGRAYSFLHLPVVAPSPGLLASERRGELAGWREFRARYDAQLGSAEVAVAGAFVEAAAMGGGLAVLLCAEPYTPDFGLLDAQAQDRCHCHRFDLASRVAGAIKGDHPGIRVERVDLDAAAFVAAMRQDRVYEPRVRPL